MAKIAAIDAYPIYDSRGERTIEVALTLAGGGTVVSSVPQGKSKGSFEAQYLEPEIAARNVVKIIAPKVKRIDAADQGKIDGVMRELDGTSAKSRLGANAILGVSFAVLKAAAYARRVPPWKHVRDLSGIKLHTHGELKPRLFVNVVNGGLHAGSGLNVQEYLIIPRAKTFSSAVQTAEKAYRLLAERLAAKFGAHATSVGDEGGYAPRCKDDLEPLRLITEVLQKMRMHGRVDLGIDAAANGIRMPAQKLMLMYKKMKKEFGIWYIEDPFKENDFKSFSVLMEKMGHTTLIAGDDLTTTNVARMEVAKRRGSVNAMIVKPNQIGTVTEAITAVRKAHEWGWKVVVSHRSGETNDDVIADFAYGVAADGFKLGAPARGERIAKYNRLLQIERELS